MTRPRSLAEVAAHATDSRELYFALAEFLDQFALERRAETLAEEPPLLADQLPAGDVADAYLAAVAVTLARSCELVPPRWVWGPRRRRRDPWFAHPGAALRATLIAESPAPFRERNLFVTANALSRA